MQTARMIMEIMDRLKKRPESCDNRVNIQLLNGHEKIGKIFNFRLGDGFIELEQQRKSSHPVFNELISIEAIVSIGFLFEVADDKTA